MAIKFNLPDWFSGELALRIKYGVLMISVALFLLIYGGGLYVSGLILLTAFCTAELFFILAKASSELVDSRFLMLKGSLMVFAPIISLYIIREHLDQGILIAFWFLSIVSIVDTMAYFIGKNFGKRKLAPGISASKTVEGFAGGVACAVAFSSFLYYAFDSKLPFTVFFAISLIIAVLAQVSDLMESKFKRKFGVKDSSNMIPGHGGFLDRMDGYILTAPTVVLLYSVSQFIFGVGLFK